MSFIMNAIKVKKETPNDVIIISDGEEADDSNVLLEENNGFPLAPLPGRRFSNYSSLGNKILFAPPFFILVNENLFGGQSSAVRAKCISCEPNKVFIRGIMGAPSRFINHLKREHPTKHELYQNIKNFKRIRAATSNENVSWNCGNAVGGSFQEDIVIEGCLDEGKELEEEGIAESIHTSLRGILRRICKDSYAPYIFIEPTSSYIEEKFRDDRSIDTIDLLETFQKQITDLQIDCNQLKEAARTATQTNKEVEALRAECAQLTVLINITKKREQALLRKVQAIESQGRRKSFLLKNIPSNQFESIDQIARRIICEKLGVADININNVNSVAQYQRDGMPRQCIMVEASQPREVNRLFKNAYKLRNTGIILEENMPKSIRVNKLKMLALRKEILRRKSNTKTFVRYATLTAFGKRFSWDDETGFSCDNGNDAIEELNSCMGSDFSGFIEILKNYSVR